MDVLPAQSCRAASDSMIRLLLKWRNKFYGSLFVNSKAFLLLGMRVQPAQITQKCKRYRSANPVFSTKMTCRPTQVALPHAMDQAKDQAIDQMSLPDVMDQATNQATPTTSLAMTPTTSLAMTPTASLAMRDPIQEAQGNALKIRVHLMLKNLCLQRAAPCTSEERVVHASTHARTNVKPGPNAHFATIHMRCQSVQARMLVDEPCVAFVGQATREKRPVR